MDVEVEARSMDVQFAEFKAIKSDLYFQISSNEPTDPYTLSLPQEENLRF